MAFAIDIGKCCKCGEPMWMSQPTYDTYQRSHQTFYCTHGHPQVFSEGESREDTLRREVNALRQRQAYYEDQLREARERTEHEKRRANGYKGHATRITKRAKAGVCPCCNRTFKQLAQHMANKHPQFTPLALEDRPPEGATVQ